MVEGEGFFAHEEAAKKTLKKQATEAAAKAMNEVTADEEIAAIGTTPKGPEDNLEGLTDEEIEGSVDKINVELN